MASAFHRMLCTQSFTATGHMRIQLIAKQAPDIAWVHSSHTPTTVATVLRSYCDKYCLQASQSTLADQSGAQLAPEQVLKQSAVLFICFRPTIAFYTWHYLRWLYPISFLNRSLRDHVDELTAKFTPALALNFIGRHASMADVEAVAALDPHALLPEDVLPISSDAPSHSASTSLSAASLYISFLASTLPPYCVAHSRSLADKGSDNAALQTVHEDQDTCMRCRKQTMLCASCSQTDTVGSNTDLQQTLVLLVKVMSLKALSLVTLVASSEGYQAIWTPLLDMICLSKTVEDPKSVEPHDNTGPYNNGVAAKLIARLVVPALRQMMHFTVCDDDVSDMPEIFWQMDNLLSTKQLASVAADAFCHAGGLALLMELFSHGDREQAELALQLLGDLLNPDLTSTEQVQSMQQMLSQQRVTEALALAMHPMCEDVEEAEATIVAQAFGQHKPPEGDIWPRCTVETRAAELMLSFIQLQVEQKESCELSCSAWVQAATVNATLQPQQACQTKYAASHPDTFADTVRSLRNSRGQAVLTQVQETTAQQQRRDHWPTPTPAAWKLTQKLVAQVAAVLEWLQSPVQHENLAQLHELDEEWDCNGISDHIDLQNLLSQILCELLLGHILDLALDMTELFQTAFGITLQGWAACSPECFHELPENAGTLIMQHGISTVLNGIHARQLGQVMLQRLAMDDQLAQKVARAFAQPSASNPLHRSSDMAVSAIFQMLEDALEVGTDLSTRSMAVMAWHPDWQLLTKAALKLIKQPDFACQVQADLHGLVKLLQPNPCVQLTAAAIVCALQHSIMQQPQSRVGQKPHPNPVLEGADLDSVLAALCQGLMANPMHSFKECAELAQVVDHFVMCSTLSRTALEELFSRPLSTQEDCATCTSTDVETLAACVAKGLGIRSSVYAWQQNLVEHWPDGRKITSPSHPHLPSSCTVSLPLCQMTYMTWQEQLIAAALEYLGFLLAWRAEHGYTPWLWWLMARTAFSIIPVACSELCLTEDVLAVFSWHQGVKHLSGLLKLAVQTSKLPPQPKQPGLSDLKDIQPSDLAMRLITYLQCGILDRKHGRVQDWQYFGATCFDEVMYGFSRTVQGLMQGPQDALLFVIKGGACIASHANCAGAYEQYVSEPPAQAAKPCLQSLYLLLTALHKVVEQQHNHNKAALKAKHQSRSHKAAAAHVAKIEEAEQAEQRLRIASDISDLEAPIGIVAKAIKALSRHPSWATICQELDPAELQTVDGSSSVASVVGQLATERLFHPGLCENIQHFVDLIKGKGDLETAAERLQQELLSEEEQNKAIHATQEAKKQKLKSKKQKQKAKKQHVAAETVEPASTDAMTNDAVSHLHLAQHQDDMASRAAASNAAPMQGGPSRADPQLEATACSIVVPQQAAPAATVDHGDDDFLQDLFCCPFTKASPRDTHDAPPPPLCMSYLLHICWHKRTYKAFRLVLIACTLHRLVMLTYPSFHVIIQHLQVNSS